MEFESGPGTVHVSNSIWFDRIYFAVSSPGPRICMGARSLAKYLNPTNPLGSDVLRCINNRRIFFWKFAAPPTAHLRRVPRTRRTFRWGGDNRTGGWPAHDGGQGVMAVDTTVWAFSGPVLRRGHGKGFMGALRPTRVFLSHNERSGCGGNLTILSPTPFPLYFRDLRGYRQPNA